MNNIERCKQLADKLTKEHLLERCKHYVLREAKRCKVEPWVVVGHMFSEGSGVSQTLWELHINKEKKGA